MAKTCPKGTLDDPWSSVKTNVNTKDQNMSLVDTTVFLGLTLDSKLQWGPLHRPDDESSAIIENIARHPSPHCTINHLDFDFDNQFCSWFVEKDISPLQSVDATYTEATPQTSRKRKNNPRKDKGNIRRRHVTEWKDCKRKILRNLGKAYKCRDGTVKSEVGHTQSKGDNVHALIEKTAKNKLIYTPFEWNCLVRWAKQTGKPYVVEELQFTNFFNYTALLKENWVKSSNGNKVQWNKIREVLVKPEDSYKLFYKYDLAADDYHVLCVKASRRQCVSNVEALYETNEAYSQGKKNHFVNMCKSQIISSTHHVFFQSLPESDNYVNIDSGFGFFFLK
ncbi:unnamed protein product [Chilo suppressalis]|uniref:Uncharacterized protein n=1 Tax=Chilo suppressalis TaxID=168631 RepID=A0ABN8BBK1_CHISP|nr:unnamed protein product [Chilo suppressalis]